MTCYAMNECMNSFYVFLLFTGDMTWETDYVGIMTMTRGGHFIGDWLK